MPLEGPLLRSPVTTQVTAVGTLAGVGTEMKLQFRCKQHILATERAYGIAFTMIGGVNS